MLDLRRYSRDKAALLGGGILVLEVILLFISAPRRNYFGWADTASHALDAAFYHDFLLAMPFAHPFRFAVEYYIHSPALTIGLYPPIFHVSAALAYFVFGISQGAAQFALSLYVLALAVAAYTLSRRWLPRGGALATAMTLIAIPAVADWGRQIMPDVPMLVFLLLSVAAFLRFLDTRAPKWLYIANFLIISGAYTKQTIAFIYLPLAIAGLYELGLKALRNKHIVINLVLTVVLVLAPFVFLFMKFSQSKAYGSVSDPGSPTGLGRWTYYLVHLPNMVGWPVALLAATFLVGSAALGWRAFRSRDAVLLGGWFVAGYLAFSVLAHKEERYGLIILYPVVLLAIIAGFKLLGERVGAIAAFCLGLLYLGQALATSIPEYYGYREAASIIAREAPRNSVVLYFGDHDNSFIFNVRREGRRDLVILRADKVLLRYSMLRSRGLSQTETDPGQISATLDQDGVQLAVVQQNFWTDLSAIRALNAVLAPPHFRRVGEVVLATNFGHFHGALSIFRNQHPVAKGSIPLALHIGPLGRTLSGKTQ